MDVIADDDLRRAEERLVESDSAKCSFRPVLRTKSAGSIPVASTYLNRERRGERLMCLSLSRMELPQLRSAAARPLLAVL